MFGSILSHFDLISTLHPISLKWFFPLYTISHSLCILETLPDRQHNRFYCYLFLQFFCIWFCSTPSWFLQTQLAYTWSLPFLDLELNFALCFLHRHWRCSYCVIQKLLSFCWTVWCHIVQKVVNLITTAVKISALGYLIH